MRAFKLGVSDAKQGFTDKIQSLQTYVTELVVNCYNEQFLDKSRIQLMNVPIKIYKGCEVLDWNRVVVSSNKSNAFVDE